MQNVFEHQDVSLQHKYDFGGVVDIPFRITLKPDVELKKESVTKIAIHYRDEIQKNLVELETNRNIERLGLDAARNNELGSEFNNPIIIFPKGDTCKFVNDARILSAITDASSYQFPLLPVQVSIPSNNGTKFSTTNLSTAKHQVGLTPETQKFVHFVVRNKQHKNK